ncbi:MAG: CDGSH iron-sulfur domain-containing protein [Hyphomicrobiaceae bacterium]
MSEEPKVAQKGPFQVELVAGKRYFWCRCGRSAKQPFCDGAHKGTGMEPLAFVAETGGVQNLCGCKQSDDMPYCDGSHLLI